MQTAIRFFALTTLVACLPSSAPANERPNVLFIMSDDHAAHAVGAYGGRLAGLDPTPVIDTLAAEGTLFENCFVTNSICTPSRACIMTGQYSHVNGATTLGGRLTPEQQYLAIEMRDVGYQTAMVGKWHLKEEPNFDYYKVLPGQGKYHNPTFREKTAGGWPNNVVQMEGHSSDCITDSTIAWLKGRDRSKPFFLMHHYKAPHDFFENAARYESYLGDVDIPEPESLWTQPEFGSIATLGHNGECATFIGTSIGPRHAFRNYTRNWAKEPGLTAIEAKRLCYQTYLRKYLRCVKGVDDNVGRLFAYMKKEGIFDNTVIFYTSDQGMMLGEHDYQDKRWMYEPSQQMPLLIRYPKAMEPGRRTEAIVENVDLGPTMLDFAGVPTPDYMQGRSLRSICETGIEPSDWRQAAYYRYWMHMAHHWNPSHFGIRTKQHKLIFYYGCDMSGLNQTPPGWELYDMEKDPHEIRNVYDDPAYADIILRLKEQLAAKRREVRDTDEGLPEIRAVVERFWNFDRDDRAAARKISHDYAAQSRARAQGNSNPTRKSQKPEVLPGGWIKPARSDAPLRKCGGFREISRNAVYRMSHTGPANFNVDNAYLLSGEAPPVKPHAFHSPENADKPFVVIRLEKPNQVRRLQIVNRKNSHLERAAGLTVWVGDDEETWRTIWQAKAIAPAWTVDTGDQLTCRYIKIGLPQSGTLHLNQVIVFGR